MVDDIARAADAKKGSPFLNTAQAAFYVGLSRRTLEKMRTHGGGPRFRRHGRYIRYHIDDLDLWSQGDRENQSGASNQDRRSSNGNRNHMPACHENGWEGPPSAP